MSTKGKAQAKFEAHVNGLMLQHMLMMSGYDASDKDVREHTAKNEASNWFANDMRRLKPPATLSTKYLNKFIKERKETIPTLKNNIKEAKSTLDGTMKKLPDGEYFFYSPDKELYKTKKLVLKYFKKLLAPYLLELAIREMIEGTTSPNKGTNNGK